MEIVKSSKFNSDDMHFNLMMYGFYCYHDSRLKDILPANIKWETCINEFGDYGAIDCKVAESILVNTQLPLYKEYYPDIKVIKTVAYYGIDTGVGIWHNDKREGLTIQTLCYQSDFEPEDGGSLRIKCYDGIERWYYPKNGDIILMNHMTETVHMIDKILTDKKRYVISMEMR